MKENEILDRGFEKIGENLYRDEKNGIIFCQHNGQIVPVRSLEPEEAKRVCDYQKYKQKIDEEFKKAKEPEPVEEDDEPDNQIMEVEEPKGGLIQPAGDIDEIASLYEQYDQLKDKIIKDEDKMTIHGDPFTKKSGWRKIATAFNISDELVSKEKQEIDEGVKWTVEVVAKAPNGRTSHGLGMCSNDEEGKGDSKEHDILATAHTRAKNRAISDLLGGEVSAEEVK